MWCIYWIRNLIVSVYVCEQMSHEVAGCLLSDCILPPLHRYILYIHTHTYIHTYIRLHILHKILDRILIAIPTPRSSMCMCPTGRCSRTGRSSCAMPWWPARATATHFHSLCRRVPPGDFLRRAESQSELQAGLLCGPSRGDRLLRICPAGIRLEPGRRRASGEVGQIGLSVCMCYYHYNHHSHNHHCRLPPLP